MLKIILLIKDTRLYRHISVYFDERNLLKYAKSWVQDDRHYAVKFGSSDANGGVNHKVEIWENSTVDLRRENHKEIYM